MDRRYDAEMVATLVNPVQALARHGFFVFEEFLDERDVAELIAAVETLESDPRSSRIRRGVAFARRNLLELTFVRTLISQPRIAELVDALEPGLIAVWAILFDKCGSANWTAPWHQDRSIAVRERIDAPGFGPWSTKAGVVHVQPPLDILQQMFTLRFNLDPCGNANGPLRVIGGTHDRILDSNEIENITASSEQTPCITSAGGLVIMRPLLLHASSPATHPSHRRVVHIEFGPFQLPAGVRWAMA